MALKFTIGALSDVQEEYRQFYNDNGSGEFTLQVDGAVSKQELKSLREANITLKREAEELEARYQGVDVSLYRQLVRQERAERDWQMFQEGRGDEVIAGRTAAMRAEHVRLLAIATAERDAVRAELDAALIADELRDAALKLGVLPEALQDVTLRGAAVLRVVDGKPIAYAGHAPVSAAEWVASLSRTSPHLFETSSSGASPGGSQAGRGIGASISRAVWETLDPASQRDAALDRLIVD